MKINQKINNIEKLIDTFDNPLVIRKKDFKYDEFLRVTNDYYLKKYSNTYILHKLEEIELYYLEWKEHIKKGIPF